MTCRKPCRVTLCDPTTCVLRNLVYVGYLMKACACQAVKLLEEGSNDAGGSGVSRYWDDGILGTVSSNQSGYILLDKSIERVRVGSLFYRYESGKIVPVQESRIESRSI